jgi:hypothetical protein
MRTRQAARLPGNSRHRADSQLTPRDFEDLDLDPIKVKLTDPKHGKGWSHEKVEKVATLYRRFLTLTRENPNSTIVPSEAIDDFWHCHILDTSKYAADCAEFFGYFLHHFPYLGLRGGDDERRLTEAFEETKNLYEMRFGESLVATDGFLAGDCSSAGCGSVVCGVGTCSSHRPIYKPQLATA